MAAGLQVGDKVIVADPDFGQFRGEVTNVDATSVYIEGPHLDGDSRVWSWTIRTDQVDRYVTALPRR